MSPARSYHERHRGMLERLASAEAIDSLLRSVVVDAGWSSPSTWRRVWGRLIGPDVAGARLLFQGDGWPARLCTIEVGPDPVGRRHVRVDGLGPAAVTFFPDDPALPTLATVVAACPTTEVVRYRPGKRCTLTRSGAAVDGRGAPRALGRGDEAVFTKVFGDDRGRRLDREARLLWGEAEAGRLGFAVAAPLGYDEATLAVHQGRVAGRAVGDELVGPSGSRLAARLGAATATIPHSGLEPTQTITPADELHKASKRAKAISAYVPALDARLATFLAAAERLTACLSPATLRPIHGSPHPSQWLSDGDDLGLVDFDRLSAGDPELDVATFQAEVDFERHRGAVEIAEAYEAGYRSVHGPLDPDRLRLYRAHKRLAKVHRTVTAVRADGADRAAAHLDRAVAGLVGAR